MLSWFVNLIQWFFNDFYALEAILPSPIIAAPIQAHAISVAVFYHHDRPNRIDVSHPGERGGWADGNVATGKRNI